MHPFRLLPWSQMQQEAINPPRVKHAQVWLDEQIDQAGTMSLHAP